MYIIKSFSRPRPVVFFLLFAIILLVGLLPIPAALAAGGDGEPRQIIVHREGGLFTPLSFSGPTRILAAQSFQQGETEVITTLVEVDDDVDLAAAIQEIEAQPGVLYAEPNYPVYLFGAPYPDDPLFDEQWGMALYDGEYDFGVSAPGAWALYEKSDKKRDGPVIVAVIDSGVDVNHPDLKNRVTEYGVQIIGGEISTEREDYSLDLSAHGTHVAGIIAAETNNGIGVAGVAGEANVKILPVKTFSLTTGTLFDIAAGIRWAVDNGADVLNLSFGSFMLTQTQADAIQYAIDNGVIVVAAAGNNRSRVDRVYPAAYPGVITVAGTEDDGAIGFFSNYGPQIDLAAPGYDILSTTPNGKYAAHTGTSMATPFVAGAAALLLAADKTLTPQAVYQRLIDHAVDLGPAGHDPDFGYGLLNVEAALRNALAEPVITLTSPFPGTTIVGTTTVTAQLAQPDQVSRVAFYLDDEDNLIRAITDEITGSLSFSWTPQVDSPGLPDGSYTLYAAAYDEEGEPLGRDSVDIEIQREEQSGLLLHIEPPSSDGTPGRAVAAQVTVYDVKRHNGQPIEKMKVASDKTDIEGDLYLPDLPMGKEYLIVANGTIIRNASDGNDQAEEWFFYTRTIDTADPAQRGRLTIDGEHALAVIPRVIKDDEEFMPSSGQLWIVKDDDDITFAATGSRWDPNLDTGKMKFWVDPGTYTFILAGNEQGDAYFLTAPDRQVTANNTNVRFEAGNSIEMKVPDQHFLERLRVQIEVKDAWDYVTTSTYCVICEIDLQERLYLAPGEYDVSFQIIYETDEDDRWTYTLHPVDGQGERVPWHVTPALDSVAFDGEYTASFAMAPGYPKGESFHFDVLITTTHEGQSYRIAQMSHRNLSTATDVSIRRVVPGSEELEDVEKPFRSLAARADAVTGVFDTSQVLEGTYVPYLKIPLGPLGGNKVLDAEGPAFDVTQSGDRALSRIEAVAPIDVWDSLPELRLYEVIDGEFQLVHTGFGFTYNDPAVAEFDVSWKNLHTEGRSYFAVVTGYTTSDPYAWTDANVVYYARYVTPDADAVVRMTPENGRSKMRQLQMNFFDRDGNPLDQGLVILFVQYKQDGLPPDIAEEFYHYLEDNNNPNLFVDVGVIDIVAYAPASPQSPADDYQYVGVYHDLSLEEIAENAGLMFDVRDATAVTVNALPQAEERIVNPRIAMTPKDVMYTVMPQAGIPLYVQNGLYQTVMTYETATYGARWQYTVVPAATDADGYVMMDGDDIVWSYGGEFVPQIQLATPSVRRGDTIRLNARVEDEAGNLLIAASTSPDEVWYDAIRTNGSGSSSPPAVMRLAPTDAGLRLEIVHRSEGYGTSIIQAVDNSPTFLLRDPDGHIVWRDHAPSYFKQAVWNVPMTAPVGTYTASYFLDIGGKTLYQKDLPFRVRSTVPSGSADGGQAPPPAAPESQEVPTAGGNLTFYGGDVSLDIPAGAFAGGSLAVRQVAEQANVTGPYRPVSPVYEFVPPAQPGRPVTLRIRVQAQNVNPAKLGIYRQAADGHWSYAGGRYSNGYITTTLNHFSRYTVLAYEPVFSDLAGHWAKDEVEILAARHIIDGVSPGIFQPEVNVTRAQAVKMLVAALGHDYLESQKSAPPLLYEDVPPDHWAAAVIGVATQQGIVQGYGNHFRPDDAITRQELAVMIARSFDLARDTPPNVLEVFKDRDHIAPWATGALASLVESGIIRGMSPTELVPEAFATRAQAAVMILRVLAGGQEENKPGP